MDRIIIFLILTVLLIAVSRRSLSSFKSHGFYRFLSWVCMAWLLAINFRHWFADPFSLHQVFSWIFLVISLYLVIAGIILIKRQGKPGKAKTDKTLYGFEQTTALVETGVYRYIRHPLYSSLIFLTWGIYLKQPAFGLLVVAVLSTVFLYITALRDEKECIVSFGDRYAEYMRRTKMFVPYLF